MKLGYAYPKRKEIINDLRNSVPEYESKFNFRNSADKYGVYKVSIDMPKYRLQNGRTQASQESYLAIHPELPENYFEIDLESEERHKIQHKILEKMNKEGSKNFFEFFQNESQDKYLIMDNKGFIINGNRRLCAMRGLYYSDKERYTRFSHIEVLLLPPCDEKDLDELEARLQLQPDMKAEYWWITRGCMIRKKQNKNNYSEDDLKRIYDKGNIEFKVDELMDMLGYADEYLQNKGVPKQYDLLGDKHKYAFSEIRKGRIKTLKKASEAKKDIFKKICFNLLDTDVGELGLGRLYNVISDVAKYIDDIGEEIENQIDIEKYQPQSDSSGNAGLFEFDNTELKISLAVEDDENTDEVTDIVKDIVLRERTLEKERNTAKFVFKQVRSANKSLQEALNAFDHRTDPNGIIEQLENIEFLVSELRGKVE